VGKGCELLFSEEGDLAYELRQGRAGRATVQAVKGMLQVAQGALGVVGAIPASAALAATPIGLAIVVGAGLVVATLDVALDATRDFTEYKDEFERALDAAKREELEARCFRCSAAIRAAVDFVTGNA
jgi:hypothetical protein